MTDASLPEMSLMQLQRQLDAARAELQDFTYAVSHDLRAPLRHINAYAQVMVEDWPDMPAEMAAHLGTIRESARLLTSQLDGLTQLSRLGLQSLNLQPVNVSALAQEVANELAAQYPQQAVQWQLATDVPLVLADAALLRQVLVQVLGNALKFSRGRTPAQINLNWHNAAAGRADASSHEPGHEQISDRATCCITIADNGAGFKPEQAQSLFKVFAKLHPPREFEGLGLGLMSSRKIIERLGGSIRIQGQVDAGCQVMICLPVATISS